MLRCYSSVRTRLPKNLRSKWRTVMKRLTNATFVRSFVQNATTMNDEVMIGEVVNHGKTGAVI